MLIQDLDASCRYRASSERLVSMLGARVSTYHRERTVAERDSHLQNHPGGLHAPLDSSSKPNAAVTERTRLSALMRLCAVV